MPLPSPSSSSNWDIRNPSSGTKRPKPWKPSGPALDALRNAAKDKDAEVAQRAIRLVEIIENSLDSLLADYRRYGLPLPPGDAKLVRFEYGGQYINGKPTPTTYFLGFLLRPGTKDNPPLLLVGTQEHRLSVFETETMEFVEPKPELVKSLDLFWWGKSTFDMNAGPAIALQCKARGWNALAQELWTSSLKQDSGQHRGGFYQPANLPNRTAVTYLNKTTHKGKRAGPLRTVRVHFSLAGAAERSVGSGDMVGTTRFLTP
jgi:hypothetical protein